MPQSAPFFFGKVALFGVILIFLQARAWSFSDLFVGETVNRKRF